MRSVDWKALIIVTAVGIGAMACLGPLVVQLPPWVPQYVLDAYARVKGFPATGEPPRLSSGANVMITGMMIMLGCSYACFRWISRPWVIGYAPRERW